MTEPPEPPTSHPTPFPDIIPTKGALRDWVDVYGPMSEAPDEAHFAAALTTISAAIGWKARITWAETAEACTISCIIEGGSATARKTTVAGTAAGLVRLAYKDGLHDQPRLAVRSFGHSSDRGLIDAVAPKDNEQAALWETEPPPGTVLVWDEFGSVLGNPNDLKGADWKGAIRATLMQLLQGRSPGIHLSGKDSPAHRCAVTILATMTRIELEQRVSHGLLRDGFMGRFCLIPHNGRPRYLAIPPHVSDDVKGKRAALADWLQSLAESREEFDVFGALTPGAKQRRTEWYELTLKTLEKRVEDSPTETNMALLEAFGRAQTTAIKIAAIAAVSEQYAPPITGLRQIRIEREHVDYGIEFAHFLLKEIKSLCGEVSDSADETYCRKVVTFLEKRGGRVSRKDLLDGVRGPGLSRKAKWEAIVGMVDETIGIEDEATAGRPRQVVWLI